jgi:3-oxoacyl-[acyl-carrier-protein] synthase II
MTDDDHLAVVGMACRVPGATSTDQFWRTLVDGVDSIRIFEPDDLRAAGVPEPLIADAGYVPAFGHLEGLTDFDAAYFGYSVAEAAMIDPQQRLFLEVAHAAIEDAGYYPGHGDATFGVFAGAAANRYFLYHLLGNRAALSAGVEPLSVMDWEDALPGNAPDYVPLRAAYQLGLSGPAVAVQTACSSSLVAVCQAAQSLLDYRCDIAVAGGAAVVETRQAGYRHRPHGVLSPSGRCRPLDAAADGMVPGNGAGAVVLKRLREAISDGDHIHAVLRGWAVTNDGSLRAGFFAPGVEGQAAAVVEALACAEVSAETVGLVEAHASSTVTGDAIEVEALRRAYRRTTQRVEYCALGSAKGNVGSLDAAAGVAGLIKAVCAVRDGLIPASLGYAEAHPDVRLAGSPFAVPTTTQPWPDSGDKLRRAAVSSFGLGGTNAHVIVEAPPPSRLASTADGLHLLALSAATPTALRTAADQLADHLDRVGSRMPLADVAYTLAVGRRPMPVRAAVVCRALNDAVTGLRAAATGSVEAETDAEAAPDEAQLREVADRWVAGNGTDLTALWRHSPGRRVPLPTYPFERQRCWIDPAND